MSRDLLPTGGPRRAVVPDAVQRGWRAAAQTRRTPDRLHGEHVVAAFEAGKDVVCTKPLVTTVDDARAVSTAAERTGRKLLVGQSTRFFDLLADVGL